LESRDVIGHVTIRLPDVDFLWVVHGEDASIWHRIASNVGRTDVDAERKKEEAKEKKEGEGKERERKSGRGKGRERERRR